jgi:hypothetical protein
MLTVSVMATRILPYPRTVVAVVGFSYKPSTVIGNPSLHRPTALCHWPVSVRLVAENDTHVSRVQTENQIDVIVSLVATVVMLVMVAVRIASMGIMTVAVMTTAIVVMASILVAVFVIITVTVSIVITVITVIGLVVGFAAILLIIAVPATIVVPGVRDQW